MKRRLVVFCREPVPGLVKSRLAKGVGIDRAVAIYTTLLEHTLETATQSGVEIMISLAAEPDPGWVSSLGSMFEIQSGGSLGQRMAEGFRRSFDDGASRTVIIGSDNPHLRPDHITWAFDALEDHAVVIGPAVDGGYWLVGQRAPGIDLFTGVPWSSSETLRATWARLVDLDVGWRELESLPDIDTEEDLRAAIEDPRLDEDLRRRLKNALESPPPVKRWDGCR